MKLLYIACNPPTERTLMIENEINELTLRISAIPGDHIQPVFLPYCRVEDFPHQIAQHRPDVLHIAAHGEEKSIYLTNAKGDPVAISAEMLSSFLPIDHPPFLTYLNSCNSGELAEKLKTQVPVVIGSTTPISNIAARASAGLFYARVAEGGSIEHAFEAARAMGRALQPTSDWQLYAASKGDHQRTRLCERFEVVARFSPLDPVRQKDDFYDLEIGVVGCPPSTRQVVLFTDDSSFNLEASDYEESDMAYEMAMVGRHSVSQTAMWFEENWISESDFRLFAVAVTPEGRIATTASMLCDAMERYYSKSEFRSGRVNREDVTKHISLLRGWDGIPAAYAKESSSASPNLPARSSAGGTKTKLKRRTTMKRKKK